jgi:uncharacterized delta-60 repeat protein
MKNFSLIAFGFLLPFQLNKMKSSVRFFTFHACAGLAAFGHAAIAADSRAYGNSVAAQRDGKIVVTGYAEVAGVDQFALVRYNSDGSLDTTLKGSGKVTTAVSADDRGQGVALQGDGKIVVTGYSRKAGGWLCFTVLRYTADGSLDTSFGDAGKVTTSVGGKNDDVESVVIQGDGKIVVAGWFNASSNNDFAVVRYNANGTLDTSFNETGKAAADFGADAYGHSVAVYGDGRIVVTGYTTKSWESKKQCALACFKANGSLDTSFNGTGKVTTNFGGDGNAEGRSVTVQTDGKIVVVGYATAGNTEEFALARYNADGTLDTSFGDSGQVMTDVGISGSNATGVALQKDGKIVVAGYAVKNSGTGYDFACVRYNTDGKVDQSFGDGGKIMTSVGQGDGKANSVAVQSDGKIIVAGSVYFGDVTVAGSVYVGDSKFAVVRYDASGKLDMSFNAAGSVLTAVGSGSKPPEAEEEDNTPRVSMAVINDPHGYTNVRDYDGKVIARVKKGERFIAAKPRNKPDDPKWPVCLRGGPGSVLTAKLRVTGFMDKARIHLLPDEPLMKLNYDASKKEWRKLQSGRKAELDDTASSVKRFRGVNYYKVLTMASNGDKQALAQFFSFGDFMDGEAAEGYYPQAWELFHVVGDKNFSNFVRDLPVTDQVGVRGMLGGGDEEFANGDVDYLQRYFPETTKILFRGEIVDWTSPDGRYSIRKTFTDPLNLSESKVSHAELIEKATGQVLCDLTDADIGVGSQREGSVLWSPDSKRFAYVSSSQTTVYQSSGKSFTKINLPLDQPPGKESDPQIRGAVMYEESVTPTRWVKADTLIFERFDHYTKLNPSSGSTHVGRSYEITVSFKGDGTANTSWKLRNDR